MTLELSIVSANVKAGGVGREHNEDRLDKILAVISEQHPHVLAIQEALFWDDAHGQLFWHVQNTLGMRGFMAYRGSDMRTALFVAAPLQIRKASQLPHIPWRHGGVRVWVEAPGGWQITFGSAHMSVGSPTQRLAEAEQITSYFKAEEDERAQEVVRPTLTAVLIDTNCADQDTDLSQASRAVRHQLCHPNTHTPDTRPVDRIVEAGFIDLGTRTDDERQPTTCGHRTKVRCDRVFASPAYAQRAGAIEVVDSLGSSDHHFLRHTLTLSEI